LKGSLRHWNILDFFYWKACENIRYGIYGLVHLCTSWQKGFDLSLKAMISLLCEGKKFLRTRMKEKDAMNKVECVIKNWE